MDMPLNQDPVLRSEPAQGVMAPARLARMLLRRSWLILGLAFAGGIGAFVYASTLPKSYTASALVAVEGDRFAIPELEGAVRDANSSDPMPFIRTEVQALTSRAQMQEVVEQLHLDQDPEFNPALRPPTLMGRISGALHNLLPSPSGGAVSAPASPWDGVIASATKALKPFQDNRSLTIDLAFTAHDPVLAARFVNTLIADYLATRTKWRDTANEGASTDMTARIAQVRGDLEGIEQKMRDLRSRSGAVGLRAGSVGQQQLEELATAADRATVERAQAEANWQRARAAASQGDSSALATVLGSSTISRLREHEAEASSRIATLAAGHGDSYPGLVGARSDLAAVRAQMAGETQRIVASLGAQLQVAQAHEADVKQQLADARKSAVAAEDVQAELKQLEADATSERQVYQTLLERAQQTAAPSAATSANLPDVRVLSAAVPPSSPSAPNGKLAGALGLVGGGVLGALIAFAEAQTQDGFANAGLLRDGAGVVVAATLSRRSVRRRLPRLVSAAPGGPEAEAMRTTRAQVRALARPARSVAFTSAGFPASSDEPASIAAAFARVAAADGERVLLIEGDLAHPSLGRQLGLAGGGVEDALRGGDWRDAIAADPAAPLDVLACAAPSADGRELFGGVGFLNLLTEARDDYGTAVVTAPSADHAGARTLARQCDATVLVVDGRRARRADVCAQAERLKALSRAPVVAILVSRS